MTTEAVEPSEATEGLRLSCGHLLSVVVISPDGTSYCSACEERKALLQAEAEEEVEQLSEPVEAVVVDGAEPGLALAQPVYGTRSTVQGDRGCWALNNRGEPCGAVKRRDGDFCTAHAGLGVAADPQRYAALGHEARREQLATRARLRLVLGDRGRMTARKVLQEKANLHAERLAGRAIDAALSPEVDDAKAAGIALSIIREADPRDQTTLTLTAEQAVEDMSLSELIAFARLNGIETGSLEATPPTAPPALTAGS